MNEDGNGVRTGAQVLALLAAPLNVMVLRGLARGPTPQIALWHEVGLPAKSTLRVHLKRLAEIGAVAKRHRRELPGVVECELTNAGWSLLSVSAVVSDWMRAAPEPLELGTSEAKVAIRALTDGWSSTMLRALATGPLSLTELSHIIDSLSYPALERRLAAMRLAGLAEAGATKGRGTTPYEVTAWLQRGVAPLLAAIRWERRHLTAEAPPIAQIDAEAAFLLALPLARLPSELSGSCRLCVETVKGDRRRLAGVTATVEEGRIGACTAGLNRSVDSWAIGPVGAWLQALVDADPDGLELGGDPQLARGLLGGINHALFGTALAATEDPGGVSRS